jgi:hypothetical protein
LRHLKRLNLGNRLTITFGLSVPPDEKLQRHKFRKPMREEYIQDGVPVPESPYVYLTNYEHQK